MPVPTSDAAPAYVNLDEELDLLPRFALPGQPCLDRQRRLRCQRRAPYQERRMSPVAC